MIPARFLFNCRIGAERFVNPVYLGNLIFLELGASALCFVTRNMAVKILALIGLFLSEYRGKTQNQEEI